MLIFSEAHLRQIPTAYAFYYNQSRTHLSLHKDAPLGRAIQRYGTIAAIPIMSGPLLIAGQLRRDPGDVLALIAGAVEFVSARLPRTIAFG
jgi:hypothetical protein